MIQLYLIRHGHPFVPDKSSYCLGHTDFPLSDLGHMQALLMKENFQAKGIAFHKIYVSPLTRAFQTATLLTDNSPPIVVQNLKERFMGEWDGKSFEEIKEKWTDLYKKRGIYKNTPIPGEESPKQALARFHKAIQTILTSAQKDECIAVVAHADVIAHFIQHIAEKSNPLSYSYNHRLSYCNYYHLQYDSKSQCFSSDFVKHGFQMNLTEEICIKLREAISLPANICQHCDAVAKNALRIANALHTANALPCKANRNNLYHAALLHDIARLHPQHELVGASYLEQLGYTEVASIIARHNDYTGNAITESAILYIADKEIQETNRISIQERFLSSKEKCKTKTACLAHKRRFEQALSIKNQINILCHKEIIQ